MKIFVFNEEEKEKEREIGVTLLEKNAALPQRDDRVHTTFLGRYIVPENSGQVSARCDERDGGTYVAVRFIKVINESEQCSRSSKFRTRSLKTVTRNTRRMRNVRLFASFKHFLSRRKSPIFIFDRKKISQRTYLIRTLSFLKITIISITFRFYLSKKKYKNITRN